MNNRYKNLAFWSWNDKIEKTEALCQLADLKDKGYGGAFIHARGGLEIKYLSEEWFSVFDACVDWAKNNYFEIWLYDEFGWPSGFGGGKVNGLGEAYQIKRLVSVNKPVDNPNYSLYQVYTKRNKKHYVYCVTDKNYVDLLNPAVARAFIESTHEVYYMRYQQYFGKVIKGIFTDEPQLAMEYPYSAELENALLKKYGIVLKNDICKLFDNNKLFLYQYYQTVAELFTQNFVKPIADWCDTHGILFTGHFAEEDGLSRQYRASGGVMANYAHMQQPGIDFLGRRLTSPVLPKQLASVKHQFKKQTVISESFGCSGWNVSFAQLAWIWGYQAAFGINKACLHLSAYSIRGTRKRDYPAFFSYQEPWWDCFSALSAEMEKMNAFVSQGESVEKLLLISPLNNLFAMPYDDNNGKNISAQFRLTVENLIAKQYAFDIGDERIMAKHAFVSAKGEICINKVVYTHIIVPDCECLEDDTLALLKSFATQGGKIVFINRKPKRCATVNGVIVANRAGLLEKYFQDVSFLRKAVIIDKYDGQVLNELVLHLAETDNEMYIFAQNISCGKSVCGRLQSSVVGQFYCGKKPLSTVCGVNGVYTNVQIPPMGNIAVILQKNESPKTTNQCMRSVTVLDFYDAQMLDDNALTVDKAYFELDGVKSALLDTAILQDAINKAVSEKQQPTVLVKVCYPFHLKECVPQLKIAAEINNAIKITLNNVDITHLFDGWFIDKCIGVADITNIQKMGANRLIIEYLVHGERSYTDTLNGFETERNLFHYKTEAESIYLLGDFSVYNENTIMDDGYLTISNRFSIGKQHPIDYTKELTCQGLYFYRGRVTYRYRLHKNANEIVALRFGEFYGVTAKVFANDKEKIIINPYATTDINDLLINGENDISITLYGSNRNIFGPFHHQSGEPAFVGNNTFRGVKSFEDSILYNYLPEDTYNERYHFVKFGIGAVMAIKYKN